MKIDVRKVVVLNLVQEQHQDQEEAKVVLNVEVKIHRTFLMIAHFQCSKDFPKYLVLRLTLGNFQGSYGGKGF